MKRFAYFPISHAIMHKIGAPGMGWPAVVLTGVARISVMSGGKPNAFGVRFTDVYQNQGGTWRMVTWQSTKLPE